MAKSDQLLSVLWLLRSRGRMTAEQLADELETSVRTIYRYIDALCASGVPVEAESGHGGGYKLPKTFREAPLFFAIDELKAMVHAGLFAEQAGYPYIEPLRKATSKMQSRLSEEQIEQLQRHISGFEVMRPARHRTEDAVLQELELAVAEGRTLTIRYEKWKGGEPEPRKVNPYGLVNRMYKWYLIAHCHLRDDMRVFRADRIVGAEPTGESFARPDTFSLRDFMKDRFEVMSDSKESGAVTVKLQGEPQSITMICDNWFLLDHVIERQEREVTLKLDEESLNRFFPRYLLSFGGNVKIVEPAELRRRVADIAMELARYHGDGGYESADEPRMSSPYR
ncbi:helix-turn-helix transcriptional regulator [Paenibacillus flagellatus]|uniref:YafY family transcriptional regulator n=1 Tax=Paenibacillus flagellatus TaxID=2211139 RepID=A0A2V5K3M8_9BACL|nr:YafY family protein [Paenibacillus flagellatus]PYI53859.1 hypothetical protein DLM86_14990 [Paenibacillus flagellatus]